MSITDTNMLHLLQYYIPQHPHSKNNSESSIAVRHDNDSTMSKYNKYLILHKDPRENRNNNEKKAFHTVRQSIRRVYISQKKVSINERLKEYNERIPKKERITKANNEQMRSLRPGLRSKVWRELRLLRGRCHASHRRHWRVRGREWRRIRAGRKSRLRYRRHGSPST